MRKIVQIDDEVSLKPLLTTPINLIVTYLPPEFIVIAEEHIVHEQFEHITELLMALCVRMLSPPRFKINQRRSHKPGVSLIVLKSLITLQRARLTTKPPLYVELTRIIIVQGMALNLKHVNIQSYVLISPIEQGQYYIHMLRT